RWRFGMPERKGRTRVVRTLCALAFLVVLPFACRAAVLFFEPSLADSDAAVALTWINALLLGLFVLVLWTVTGRAWCSGWVVFWLAWGLHALNRAKVDELERMLSPEDLALAGQVVGNLTFFTGYVGLDGLALAAMAGGVLATVLLARFEPRTLPRVAWRM